MPDPLDQPFDQPLDQPLDDPSDPDTQAPTGTDSPARPTVPLVPGTSLQPPSTPPLPDPALSSPQPPEPGDASEPGDGSGSESSIPSELLQLVLTTPTVQAYLDELVLLVQRLNPVIAGCGITVRQVAGILTVSASNTLAAAVDEVQYHLSQGPCLQALRTGEVVTVDDVATEQRFGDWSAHAVTHGVLSSLSVPLRIAGVTVGAMNSYSRRAHGFDALVRRQLLELAAHAQASLALTLRAAEQTSIVDQLHTAMQTRSIIDQALGIMMTRQRCTAAEAFALLRAASQSRNRKVVDIAADLITTTTGSPPAQGRFEV